MDRSSASEVKELGLKALKSRGADERKAALLELRKYDQPIVVDVLERVIQKDHDREVRDLAQNLLTKKRIDKTKTGISTMVEDTVIAERMPNSAHIWKCRFCGCENDDGDKCAYCGAVRVQSKISPSSNKMDPDSVFFVDKANRRFVEGKTHQLSGSLARLGCVIFVPMFMAAVGFFVLVLVLNQWTQFTALARLGTVTTGEITGRDTSEDSDGDDTYYIMFKFVVNGQEYSDRQTVSWDKYRSIEVGARADIEYVSNNPSVAVLAGTNQPPIFLSGFALCWNAFVWAIVIGLVNTNRRDNQLIREGRLLRGEVVTASGKSDSDNDFVVTVEYAFKAPETSKLIIGTQRKTRNDLDKASLPTPGTPLAVLFRNEKHHKAL